MRRNAHPTAFELARMQDKDKERKAVRASARSAMSKDANPHYRKAVTMAEHGFGVTAITQATGILPSIARKLVTGE
jgi:hypothetical protein